MISKYEFINENKLEKREYQINIVNSVNKKNSLIVLPTGMGKTIIALLIIGEELKKKNNKILFLAPTKPLVLQHTQFLKNHLKEHKKNTKYIFSYFTYHLIYMIWNYI